MRKKGQKISPVKAGIETQTKINLCSILVFKYKNLGQYFDLIDTKNSSLWKGASSKRIWPQFDNQWKKNTGPISWLVTRPEVVISK